MTDNPAANAERRPPLPPFTRETAIQKVRMAEDAWNTREPERVSRAYSVDSRWRNRAEFFSGRDAIVAFLTRKWARELDYRLIKELWAFTDEPHRGALRLRMARRLRPLVPLVRQRELGVRRERTDARAPCQHQRSADRGVGAAVSLAAGSAARRSSGIVRSRLVTPRFGRACQRAPYFGHARRRRASPSTMSRSSIAP